MQRATNHHRRIDKEAMAIRLKRPKNSVTVEVCMFSKLTRLPYDAIRSLYGPDYTALREALNELNAPEGEDPTMTPETDGMAGRSVEGGGRGWCSSDGSATGRVRTSGR